jgi:hypothetical protein
MKIEIDLGAPQQVSFEGATLTLDGAGVATLRSESESASLPTQIKRTAVVWPNNGWACFIGHDGETGVYAVLPSDMRITLVGAVERLDLTGHYDPGGLHHVNFVDVGNDVLLVHEFGVARVARDGIVWSQTHGDLSAQLIGELDEHIWLKNDVEGEGKFGYALADGRRSPADGYLEG